MITFHDDNSSSLIYFRSSSSRIQHVSKVVDFDYMLKSRKKLLVAVISLYPIEIFMIGRSKTYHNALLLELLFLTPRPMKTRYIFIFA